jgi:4-carboxymuconolactone decarboxylase
LPAIPPEQWTEAQRDAAAEMASGPRGAVIGPFIAALRSPECTRRLQRLGAYLRYESAIPAPLREVAVLLTARRWRQDFEWRTHEPLARAAGVSPATIDAIRAGTTPESLSDGEAVVFEMCQALFADAAVPDLLYARGVALLGEAGVIDLVCAVGYYSTLAMIMNVARTNPPEGSAPVEWSPRT